MLRVVYSPTAADHAHAVVPLSSSPSSTPSSPSSPSSPSWRAAGGVQLDVVGAAVADGYAPGALLSLPGINAGAGSLVNTLDKLTPVLTDGALFVIRVLRFRGRPNEDAGAAVLIRSSHTISDVASLVRFMMCWSRVVGYLRRTHLHTYAAVTELPPALLRSLARHDVVPPPASNYRTLFDVAEAAATATVAASASGVPVPVVVRTMAPTDPPIRDKNGALLPAPPTGIHAPFKLSQVPAVLSFGTRVVATRLFANTSWHFLGFSRAEVAQIKATATRHLRDGVSFISTNDAMMAHLWQLRARIAFQQGLLRASDATSFQQMLNLRSRLPGVPASLDTCFVWGMDVKLDLAAIPRALGGPPAAGAPHPLLSNDRAVQDRVLGLFATRIRQKMDEMVGEPMLRSILAWLTAWQAEHGGYKGIVIPSLFRPAFGLFSAWNMGALPYAVNFGGLHDDTGEDDWTTVVDAHTPLLMLPTGDFPIGDLYWCLSVPPSRPDLGFVSAGIFRNADLALMGDPANPIAKQLRRFEDAAPAVRSRL